MKRLFDLLVSFALLAVFAPLMLAVCAIIMLTDGLPVMFRQQRMGLHSKRFEVLKFRSMVVNAASLGGHSTTDNDPRITPIGRFLRKTSLDELPQLINVLRGDMSLVGPRPDVPAQMADYAPDDWALRCSVRPGITGLAQSRMRSNATPEQRLALDLEYARNPGLLRDLAILFSTAFALFSKGAN
ncbi:MAG: sugar transferase [Sphingorhabdus sp.]